jgi:outer membrane protein assembly factor BamA
MKPHPKIFSSILVIFVIGFVSPTINTPHAQRRQPLVEGVEVVGNRRLTAKEILAHVKTRIGEPFSAEKSQRDLDALFALGVFDKTQTRVITDSTRTGGVVVIFEVVELPLLSDIKVKNLRGITESEILKRFQEKDLNLVKGAPYDPVRVRSAGRVLREILASHGWPDAVVTIGSDYESQHISVWFDISYEE